MSRTSTAAPAPTPVVDADLKKLIRALKLGRMLDTLPERLALAKQQSLPYADFLSLVSPTRSNAVTAPARTCVLEGRSSTRPCGSRRSTATARSATTTNSGTNCAHCGSSTTPAGR